VTIGLCFVRNRGRYLHGNPFLLGLREQEVEKLFRVVGFESAAAGTVIFRTGEDGDTFYFVVKVRPVVCVIAVLSLSLSLTLSHSLTLSLTLILTHSLTHSPPPNSLAVCVWLLFAALARARWSSVMID
jgi:hypothetical protein